MTRAEITQFGWKTLGFEAVWGSFDTIVARSPATAALMPLPNISLETKALRGLLGVEVFSAEERLGYGPGSD